MNGPVPDVHVKIRDPLGLNKGFEGFTTIFVPYVCVSVYVESNEYVVTGNARFVAPNPTDSVTKFEYVFSTSGSVGGTPNKENVGKIESDSDHSPNDEMTVVRRVEFPLTVDVTVVGTAEGVTDTTTGGSAVRTYPELILEKNSVIW
jgi:hypothetical protein